MKLLSLNIENNLVLGDLYLDFSDKNGFAVDTIIIAGDNGVGKTVLLNLLFNISNFNFWNTNNNNKIYSGILTYTFQTTRENLLIISETFKENIIHNFTGLSLITETLVDNTIAFKINFDINLGDPNYDNKNIIYSYLDSNFTFYLLNLPNYPNFKLLFQMIFSETDINYYSEDIRTIGTKELDRISSNNLKSSSLSSSHITQLLVDINTQDAIDLSYWVGTNPGLVPTNNVINTRLNRFTKAFNFMFKNKKFKSIINEGSFKKVLFMENDNEMYIENLSSGEKQIVYRASFLLENKNSLKGAIVLIDEPEISMHPSWQLKILEFYKTLFRDEQGVQTSQIFVTTHSPFIIHNHNRQKDKVIILKKDVNGSIIVQDKPRFYGWSEESLVEDAFDISNFYEPDKTVVLVEGKTDEMYLNRVYQLFDFNSNIVFKALGTYVDGISKGGGAANLSNAKQFLDSEHQLLKHNIILLYDHEEKVKENNNTKPIVLKLKKNEENTIYKIGIENALVLPNNFVPKNYAIPRQTDNAGMIYPIYTLDKMRLCKDLLEYDVNEQKEIFKILKVEIERIINLINNNY